MEKKTKAQIAADKLYPAPDRSDYHTDTEYESVLLQYEVNKLIWLDGYNAAIQSQSTEKVACEFVDWAFDVIENSSFRIPIVRAKGQNNKMNWIDMSGGDRNWKDRILTTSDLFKLSPMYIQSQQSQSVQPTDNKYHEGYVDGYAMCERNNAVQPTGSDKDKKVVKIDGGKPKSNNDGTMSVTPLVLVYEDGTRSDDKEPTGSVREIVYLKVPVDGKWVSIEEFAGRIKKESNAATLKWSDEDVIKAIAATAYEVRENGYGGCSVAAHFASTWGKKWLKSYKDTK